MSLTCSLIYTPSLKNTFPLNNNLKYLCSDNKIHIRFKDYKEKDLIEGFESKLTYLLTYLMNFYYLPQVIKSYDSKKIISDFLKDKEITNLSNQIKFFLCSSKFKGFKLTPKYSKKKALYKEFGYVLIDCFPSHLKDTSESIYVEKMGSINTFLKYFNLSDVITYLFDDSIVIIIHEKKDRKLNKFDKKEYKKLTKIKSNSNFKELDLWE